jgi:hypothetical protein
MTAYLCSREIALGILDFIKKKKVEKNVGDTWTVAEGLEDELPVIYRFRTGVPEGVSLPEYPYLLSILWQYEIENQSGMPSKEQNGQQFGFENALDQMDNIGHGTLMAVITGNGRREWIWYVNDAQEWLKKLHMFLEGHPVYPLEIEQTEDIDWLTWRAICDGCKSI